MVVVVLWYNFVLVGLNHFEADFLLLQSARFAQQAWAGRQMNVSLAFTPRTISISA